MAIRQMQEYRRGFLRPIVATLAIACLVVWTGPAQASRLEIAPGVFVTKKHYPVPTNEQPFFGAAEKTADQIAADKEFLRGITATKYPLDQAFRAAIIRGWQSMAADQLDQAAKRFNQAHLLIPAHPDVLHGFAVIVHLRFGDAEFAEELFKTGSMMRNRSPEMLANYGRFLLVERRPAEARPVLLQAVEEQPDHVVAWMNLAFARLLTDDQVGACDALVALRRLPASEALTGDLEALESSANC